MPLRWRAQHSDPPDSWSFRDRNAVKSAAGSYDEWRLTAACLAHSDRHMNVKPGSGFSIDHSSFTSTSGSQDCASCHSYPGTGTPSAANWYGASFDHTKNFPITAAD